jgi:hypothetical protein
MATEVPAVPSDVPVDATIPAVPVVTLPAAVLDPAAPVPASKTSPKVFWQTVAAFVVTVILGMVNYLTPETFAALGPVLGPLLYALVVALAGYGAGWLAKDPIRDVGTRAIAEDAAATMGQFFGRHGNGVAKHLDPNA